MSLILDLYGRLVMAGQAKDYAIGMYKDQAVFAIFHRYAENPTWSVLKTPSLSHAQGAYSVIGAQGQTLKRGRDLQQVLKVLQSRRFEVVKQPRARPSQTAQSDRPVRPPSQTNKKRQ